MDVTLIRLSLPQWAKSFIFSVAVVWKSVCSNLCFSFSGSSGGICEKSKLYSDGKKKSLNTGIITVQNYASHVPPKVSHITFAHEVGHNFGSPVSYLDVPHLCTVWKNLLSSHTLSLLLFNLWFFFFSFFLPSHSQHDSGSECTPGESKSQDKKEKGNYIMYARATSGDKLNNNKFSICSVRNISQVLEKKRSNCFVGTFLLLLNFQTLFFIWTTILFFFLFTGDECGRFFNPIMSVISQLIQATREAPIYWLIMALKSDLATSPVSFVPW